MADKVLPVDREALAKALHAMSDRSRFLFDLPAHEGLRRNFFAQADALIASPVLRALAAAVWDESRKAEREYAWKQEDADAAGQWHLVRTPVNPYREQAR